jgi:hypothetical protein
MANGPGWSVRVVPNSQPRLVHRLLSCEGKAPIGFAQSAGLIARSEAAQRNPPLSHYTVEPAVLRSALNTRAIKEWWGDRNVVSAVAIRKGQNRAKAAGFITMGTVRRDSCGEEFMIGHHPALANAKNTERQAKWLERVLAYDH